MFHVKPALLKNEIRTLTVDGYTAEGMGVCRADGQVVFVAGALDGETLDVRIVKVLARHAFGRIERIVQPSPHRVKPDCPHDKTCGGCALRHMDYDEELRLKSQKVLDALTRIGGAALDEVPIRGADALDGYRNKAIFPVATVDGAPAAGFFRARTHELCPVVRCRLQPEAADLAKDAVIAWMREYRVPTYDENTHTGLVRDVYVRVAPGTGEVLVCPVVNGKAVPHERELLDKLQSAVPGLKTVVVCENMSVGNSVLAGDFRTLYGSGTVDDTLCGLRYRLSPRSFYQVNRDQAQRLYELAISQANLQKTDVALDLYCGTGTITLLLARRCGRAIGVEVVEAAVADARENAKRNGIENAEFFCADAGEAASRLAAEGTRPDVIVVDPPRKGLSPDVIEAIAQMAPQRAVYVSCDPATLGRDVALLAERGYALRTATAVDLFPRTPHVETVVLLSRK
ncbi:MAG: 23S rRNA (uracil(1939)-C(5))-methyltransferase RlmD [Oscillospiraceae bacterium]|nr:23S rRNA (uracil(1939)-C(5))-methyltransferase RlmD [Oscillospiraceae bacterium]